MKVKTIRPLEIRGKEKKTSSKNGKEYIIARCEDIDTGKSYELLDRNMEHYDYYVRGKLAYFTLDLNMGKYTNVSVSEFSFVDEKEEH